MRGEPVSRADELLTFFNQTRQPKSRPPHSTKSSSSITNLKIRKRNCSRSWKKSRGTAAQNQKLHSAAYFELVLARDDLLARVPELTITRPDLTLERLISEEEPRLIEILSKLPSAKERRVLQALPGALGGLVQARLANDGSNNPRLVAQIPRFSPRTGRVMSCAHCWNAPCANTPPASEMMVWLCRERAQLAGADYAGNFAGHFIRDRTRPA